MNSSSSSSSSPSPPQRTTTPTLFRLTPSYISPDPWYRPSRLSWLGVFFGSCFLAVTCALKASTQLLALQPINALKTLVVGSSISAGLAVISITSAAIHPIIGKTILRKSLVTGRYQKKDDETLMADNPESIYEYPKHKVKKDLLKTPKGIVESVTTEPTEVSDISDKYIIHFSGQSGYYQKQVTSLISSHVYPKLKESKEIPRAYRASQPLEAEFRINIGVNYPGINPELEGHYSPESSADLVNAGIAQVYQVISTLTEKNKWQTLKDLQDNLKHELSLAGRSLGGAVALQIAAHFKEKHQLDIPVFADRTFSTLKGVISENGKLLASIPTAFGKSLGSLILHAGGGWEMNSVEACKKLDSEMVHYVNVELPPPSTPPQPPSLLQRWRTFLGCDTPPEPTKILDEKPPSIWKRIQYFFFNNRHYADPVIMDASLANGVQKAAEKIKQKEKKQEDAKAPPLEASYSLMSRSPIKSKEREEKKPSPQLKQTLTPDHTCKQLAERSHAIYPNSHDPHNDPLTEFSIFPREGKTEAKETGEDIYRGFLNKHGEKSLSIRIR